MDIVFEPLVSSPETFGTQAANLPALQSVGHQLANTGTGDIRLESVGVGSLTTMVTGTGLGYLPGLMSFGAQPPGGYGVGFLGALVSSGFQAAGVVPNDGEGDAELPELESAGTGVLHLVGVGAGDLPLLQAQGHEAAGNWGVAILPALTSAGIEESPAYTAYVSGALPRFVMAATATNDLHAIAGFVPGDSMSFQHAIPVLDGFALAATATSLQKSIVQLQEATTFAAVATLVRQFNVIEAIVLNAVDITTHRRIIAAIEAIEVLATAQNKLKATHAMVAAIVIEALGLRGWQFDEIESTEFKAEAVQTLRHIEALVEAIVLEDAAETHARFTLAFEEGVVLNDVATSNARFFYELSEAVLVTARLTLRGDDYVAWAINAESGAPSRYSGFGFNSMAGFEIGGVMRYFGAMDDGIHELGGNTDNGAQIKATVRGALTNFGSSVLKGMPMAYVALSTDGDVVMKFYITDPNTGQRECHWYRLEGRPAPALREDRLKPDKGIESVYWNWELINLDGADFSIDALGFVPLFLSKRVY